MPAYGLSQHLENIDPDVRLQLVDCACVRAELVVLGNNPHQLSSAAFRRNPLSSKSSLFFAP